MDEKWIMYWFTFCLHLQPNRLYKQECVICNAGAPGRMGIVDTENHPHQDLTEFSSFTFNQSFEQKDFFNIFIKY